MTGGSRAPSLSGRQVGEKEEKGGAEPPGTPVGSQAWRRSVSVSYRRGRVCRLLDLSLHSCRAKDSMRESVAGRPRLCETAAEREHELRYDANLSEINYYDIWK